jgi:hypothetical protein
MTDMVIPEFFVVDGQSRLMRRMAIPISDLVVFAASFGAYA